jgi:hypothetical protein
MPGGSPSSVLSSFLSPYLGGSSYSFISSFVQFSSFALASELNPAFFIFPHDLVAT